MLRLPTPTPFLNRPRPAVFLSYARGDAEASRHIAEALRGFGVEVWLDRSELRGGNAWDANIKKQVRACALFIPIISAHRQAREEGCFRRGWKMAVDRTHDMPTTAPSLSRSSLTTRRRPTPPSLSNF